jgi:hypothetical protein
MAQPLLYSLVHNLPLAICYQGKRKWYGYDGGYLGYVICRQPPAATTVRSPTVLI